MINDETLTLYFYNDGLSADERREIAAALAADKALDARYRSLCQQLESLRNVQDFKAPQHLLHRLHEFIDEATRVEAVRPAQRRGTFHWWSFAWGGAIAAALAVVIGMYFSGNPATELPNVAPAASTSELPESFVPVAFTRGLQAHLRDSQTDLAQMHSETVADRNELLLQIIQQNRAFERAAITNNAQSVARLLRAFEPILMRLASDDIAPEDAEALRAQLAFELNVVLTKLANSASDDEQTI